MHTVALMQDAKTGLDFYCGPPLSSQVAPARRVLWFLDGPCQTFVPGCSAMSPWGVAFGVQWCSPFLRYPLVDPLKRHFCVERGRTHTMCALRPLPPQATAAQRSSLLHPPTMRSVRGNDTFVACAGLLEAASPTPPGRAGGVAATAHGKYIPILQSQKERLLAVTSFISSTRPNQKWPPQLTATSPIRQEV